jgi:hypothetical protein
VVTHAAFERHAGIIRGRNGVVHPVRGLREDCISASCMTKRSPRVKKKPFSCAVVAIALVCSSAMSVHAAEGWIERLAGRVATEGASTSVPPHLALVLGIGSGETAVPARQLVERAGTHVRIFEVAEAKGARVILLIHYDEASRLTEALHVRANGTLKQAVTYAAGAQPKEVPADKASALLGEALAYWKAESARR